MISAARSALASVLVLLVLAACGGGEPPPTDAEGTTLVGVELSEPAPATFASGEQVTGNVRVRTDETEGIRVWLMPPGDPSPAYSFQPSSLLQGSDIEVQRWFRVAAGDDDRTLDTIRVVARDADGERVLDEQVSADLTVRSVASTSPPALDPASGNLEHGDRVDVSVDFTLESTRAVEVSLGPLRPSGYDDASQGDWLDVRDFEDQLFDDVDSGTMTGSFTITDEAQDDVAIDTLYVSIRDLDTMTTIYMKLLEVDYTYTEPKPADLTVGIVPSRDDATLEASLDARRGPTGTQRRGGHDAP